MHHTLYHGSRIACPRGRKPLYALEVGSRAVLLRICFTPGPRMGEPYWRLYCSFSTSSPMGKKRKQPPVVFHDHTAYRNQATASRFDYDYNTRRLVEETRVVDYVAPDNAAPERPFSPPPPDDSQYIQEDSVGVIVRAKTKAKRYVNSDVPLDTWLQYRECYMEELLRCSGRGTQPSTPVCQGCSKIKPRYRCEECFGKALLCKECCVEMHRRLPLHRIKEWTGQFFRRTTLLELGLVVPLGDHTGGSPCPMASKKKIVVLHTNGIHEVAVEFCECRTDAERFRQLLRASWYPATPLSPETCATFMLLDQFHLLNLQGNVTVYDFVKTLEFLTDGWLLEEIPDRHQSFLNIVREWRNLEMLKRAGRGHEEGGIATTAPGGWQLLVVPARILGSTFQTTSTIAVDCNFRLKNRHRTSNKPDVSLSPGWAYFVERGAYMAHVKQHTGQAEMNTCSGFTALLLANLKKAKGLNATGVVGVACSRHEHWRPNGLGDLQKGERQCNVDYVLLSALVGVSIPLLITYDIACQYFKAFWTRMLGFPEGMRLAVPDQTWVTAKVPKGHIRAHEDACQGPYSLNYTVGVGLTDGEGIERLWSWLNKVAASSKEMTQAARQELLDDFCAFINWRKTLGIYNILARRLLDAIKNAKIHREEFIAFNARVRERAPAQLLLWEAMLLAWAGDHTKPCPYTHQQPRVTFNAVRLAILREEEEDMRLRGRIDDNSPAAFICLGIEIEHMQMALKADIAHVPFGNVLTELARNERRRAIRRKILDFRRDQRIHMPGLNNRVHFAADGSLENGAALQPEDIPLYLPSDSGNGAHRDDICDRHLVQLEDRLPPLGEGLMHHSTYTFSVYDASFPE
ncbi:hypothetical protein BC629DRAFT_1439482 [Irpex lacteus]|nr:hypothetical protein BC629DRAFT_1439482 [Irpex lacteus]